jgi:signal transduction histidine kinase
MLPSVTRLRGRAADAVLAAVVTVFVVGAALLGVQLAEDRGALDTWATLVIVAAGGSLFFRRRFPIQVALFTLAASVLYYVVSPADGPILMTFVVALYTVAAERHLTVAVVLGVGALLAVAFGEASGPVRHMDDVALFMFAGWLVAVVAVGAVIANRRAYLAEAERATEEAANQRATEERLRIARELHDVLGHNLSLINVQASAALHRKDPDQAYEALAAIKQSSKEALRELRATLGVLRQVDEQAPVAPGPGLARLPDLVGQAAAAGLEVRTEVEGEVRPVPAEVDLAAYRIVQEALTNVTRHAGVGTAHVRIRYDAGEMSVRIDDDGVGGEGMAGNGIRGMGERARALGGELTAAPRPEGGFRVLARLPLDGRTP